MLKLCVINYCLPSICLQAIYAEITRYLASQYERFKQVLLLAIRREKYNVPTNEEIKSIQRLAESDLSPLGCAPEPVYPLPTHYCQTWQHLPDYGAYHAALISDPVLPGKWQPGEEVVYLLMFEGDAVKASAPRMLVTRLTETLPIPILDEWHESLWESGQKENLIVGLETSGDCQAGYIIQLGEIGWKEVVIRLLKERKIWISSDR